MKLPPPRLFAFLPLSILFACNSGGGGGPGQVDLVLTDAPSEELSQFEVDVSNVVFRKTGGVEVSVLPRATRVDFAELKSLSELVSMSELESGSYSSVTMTLDFTNANVVIDQATTPATVVDRSGNPITGELDVVVQFPRTEERRFLSQRHLFVLDLELDQSVEVNRSSNEVTFTPVLVAVLDPAAEKPIVTTGFVRQVTADAGTFVLARHRDAGVGSRSTFTVQVTPMTVFQIDGVPAVGLEALVGLTGREDERVFVQGTLSRETRVLLAETVEAGAGVLGNGQDHVLGHVVARSGGAGANATLTVLGRSYAGSGQRRWSTQFTTNVSFANTRVVRRGGEDALTTDAIGVGQLVALFGELDGTTLDAGEGGVARLLPTSIYGTATEAPTGDVLTLDVVRIDRRPVAEFDFTVESVVEADPDAFTIDVSGLSTDGIEDGSRVRVSGWINPIGISGDENARAATIVDRGTGAKSLTLKWDPASATAIAPTQGTEEEIVFDVTDAETRRVSDGFANTTIDVTPPPVLRPLAIVGIYRIVGDDDHGEQFTNFTAFREAVLSREQPVRKVSALGTFDATTQVFAAIAATVEFRGENGGHGGHGNNGPGGN